MKPARLIAVLMALLAFLAAAPASAFEPIDIGRDDKALDLSQAAEMFPDRGSSFQVSTAAGPDGIVRRIEVESSQGDRATGDWAVFALANTSDAQLDRLIVAPHYRIVGSGLVWPDLGSNRIANITPSAGFALERQASADADIFLVTLDPGTVITFVAELSSQRLPQVYLWEPDAYKDSVNSYTLFRGIVIGIAGLLALFLTILFVVKGTSMFPATAALAWAVLAYIAIDFGFLNRLIEVTAASEQVWRAGSEVALAATLIVFLFAYLNLNRWHEHFSYGALIWVFGLFLLAGVAVFDPAVAAGVSRMSFAATAALGLVLIAVLGIQGYDRAIMLVPSWIMTLVWLGFAFLAVTGRLDNDVVQPALGGGLILVLLLIGFTVMQHAFAAGGFQQGLFSDMERQALAVTGAGDVVWDWDVSRDRIVTRPDLAPVLGLDAGELTGPARNWLPVLHVEDRDMFRATLDTVLEFRRGRIAQAFRLRGADGHYHWYQLRARPVIGSDGEIIRCVGTMIDVTEQKKAEERLLYDAVHDNLTGLPNRQLFLERLDAMISMAKADGRMKPTVLVIDVDRFKQVNDGLGIAAGDTFLLTLARRLYRLTKPIDALSRFSGDQFAIMLLSEQDPTRIAALADAVKQAIRAPISFAKREIVLTPSIGLVTWTPDRGSAADMIKDAEIAMHQAKRFGGDRIEPFRPAFRSNGADRLQFEADLGRAIELNQMRLVYQPIVRLSDDGIAGFEALPRWEHPRRGLVRPSDFVPVAETCGAMTAIGQFVLQRAADDLVAWQRQTGDEKLSVWVAVPSHQLLRRDLVTDVRSAVARAQLAPECFHVGFSEQMVIDNPEQAASVLDRIADLGVSLSLDDFGAGHTSLVQLGRLPFGAIKLDRSLFEQHGAKRAALIGAIVRMAHDLGVAVVAKGATEDEDLSRLREAGCEFAQSYRLGQPMNAEAVTRMLRDQKAGLLRPADRTRNLTQALIPPRFRREPATPGTRPTIFSRPTASATRPPAPSAEAAIAPANGKANGNGNGQHAPVPAPARETPDNRPRPASDRASMRPEGQA